MPSGVRNLMSASVTLLSIIESEVGILHHNHKSILYCLVTSVILLIHINCNLEMSEVLSVCFSECSKQSRTSNTKRLLFSLVTLQYLHIAPAYRWWIMHHLFPQMCSPSLTSVSEGDSEGKTPQTIFVIVPRCSFWKRSCWSLSGILDCLILCKIPY